jgi:hypothetical protein
MPNASISVLGNRSASIRDFYKENLVEVELILLSD